MSFSEELISGAVQIFDAGNAAARRLTLDLGATLRVFDADSMGLIEEVQLGLLSAVVSAKAAPRSVARFRVLVTGESNGVPKLLHLGVEDLESHNDWLRALQGMLFMLRHGQAASVKDGILTAGLGFGADQDLEASDDGSAATNEDSPDAPFATIQEVDLKHSSMTFLYSPKAIRGSGEDSSAAKKRLALDNDTDVVRAGFLEKRGRINKAYKKRWIVLRRNGEVEYFAQPVEGTQSKSQPNSPANSPTRGDLEGKSSLLGNDTNGTPQPLGSFSVKDAHDIRTLSNGKEFEIVTKERIWAFRCLDPGEKARWLDSVKTIGVMSGGQPAKSASISLLQKTFPGVLQKTFSGVDSDKRSPATARLDKHRANARRALLEARDEEDAILEEGVTTGCLPERRTRGQRLRHSTNSERLSAQSDSTKTGPSQASVVKLVQNLNINAGRRASLQWQATQIASRPPIRRNCFTSKAPKDSSECVEIAIVSWNLNAKLPQPADLRFMKSMRDAGVVVVGVQESQQPSVLATDLRGQYTLWQEMLIASLGRNFVPVVSRLLGAIHLIVFVAEEKLHLISGIHAGVLPCGVGNVGVNKGAVGVSMRIAQKHVCFVTAHLAAGHAKVRERNANLARVFKLLPDQMNPIWARTLNTLSSQNVKVQGDKFSMHIAQEKARRVLGLNRRLEEDWNTTHKFINTEEVITRQRRRPNVRSERLSSERVSLVHAEPLRKIQSTEQMFRGGFQHAYDTGPSRRSVCSMGTMEREASIHDIPSSSSDILATHTVLFGYSALDFHGRPGGSAGEEERGSLQGERILHEGSLCKRPRHHIGVSAALGRWHLKRFFLTPTRIAYAEITDRSSSDPHSANPQSRPQPFTVKGSYDISEATMCTSLSSKEAQGREFVFRLWERDVVKRGGDPSSKATFSEVRPLYLQAASEDERQRWVIAICGAIGVLLQDNIQALGDAEVERAETKIPFSKPLHSGSDFEDEREDKAFIPLQRGYTFGGGRSGHTFGGDRRTISSSDLNIVRDAFRGERSYSESDTSIARARSANDMYDVPSATTRKSPSEAFIQRFDACFFFGDLNYRLELEKGTTEAVIALSELQREREVPDGEDDGFYTRSSAPKSSVSSRGDLIKNEELLFCLSRAASNAGLNESVRGFSFAPKWTGSGCIGLDAWPRRVKLSRNVEIPKRSEVSEEDEFFSVVVKDDPWTPEHNYLQVSQKSFRQLEVDMASFHRYDYKDYGQSALCTLAEENALRLQVRDWRTGRNAQGSFRESADGTVDQDADPGSEGRMKLSVLNHKTVDDPDAPNAQWDKEALEPSQPTSTSSIQEEEVADFNHVEDAAHTADIREGDTLPKGLRVALSHELLEQISSHALDADQGQLDSVDMLELLLSFDQLRAQRSANNILQGWQEGRITFPPTYKFDPYTARYDTSKKSRVPSWTDRVFYAHPESPPANGAVAPLELLGYSAVQQPFHSDHRPVIARFRLRL